MTIKFFVASSIEDKEIAKQMADDIAIKFKWINKSRWWDYDHTDKAKRLQYAIEDLNALRDSDVLFVYNGEKKTSGKYVEIGVALALNKPIFVYGKPLTTVYSELLVYCGDKFE